MKIKFQTINKNARVFLFMVLLINVYVISCGKSKTLKAELLDQISKYEIKRGHLPKCKNSAELIDTLGLNGNEFYPEYFEYQYYDDNEYYVLRIILHHESNNLIIDSRKPN